MKTIKKTVRANPKRLSIAAPVSSKKKLLYDKDFFKWTKAQANVLKKGRLDDLDIRNLVEEIESLGRNDKRSLSSQTVVLLTHLLKLKYQPHGQGNSKSWHSSVLNSTREIKKLIKDSPSLKNELIKEFSEAYEDAKQSASVETGLDITIFPKACPWTIEELFPELYKKPKTRRNK